MKDALTMVGYLILVIGTFMGFTIGNVFFILLSVVGGLVLLALGKIVAIAEVIQHKLLEIPYTNDQMRAIVKKSPAYIVETDEFEVYPDGETHYPLILLHDEYYIRARVFYKYISQTGNDYDFRLPGQEPITITKSDHYFQGAELFAKDEQVFVMIKALNFLPIILGNKLILERGTKE